MEPGISTGRDRPILIVAAVTPLTEGGTGVDEPAIEPYVEFLESHGVDGVFCCGTTGEGVLLSVAERRLAAGAFRAAVNGTLIVHAGAQTTADTCELASHAREIEADGVAVIAPPYFPLDDESLSAHFIAAAHACAPLPFYCYAFSPRSGYPLPVGVIRRIAEAAPNLAGLKVSESPFERVEPYLELGLPVLIGNEPLIPAGLTRGAIGSVSGVASAFPDVVRDALDHPEGAAERLLALRSALEGAGQLISAAKHVLGARDVMVGPDVRAPLRTLGAPETAQLDARLRELGLLGTD